MEPGPNPILVCGCQPPDTLCDHGQRIVARVKRESKLMHQFGADDDAVDRRNQALTEWATHIYQDHASAIALLPKAVL